ECRTTTRYRSKHHRSVLRRGDSVRPTMSWSVLRRSGRSPPSPSHQREAIHRLVPVGLSGIEPRRRKIGTVGRVGPGLRFEAEGIRLPIESVAFAAQRAVEEVAGIELQAGLVGQQLHDAPAMRGFDPRSEAHAIALHQTIIVIVAAAAPQLLVIGSDTRADRFELAEIERRAFD